MNTTITITRKFVPVGQGLFCYETFSNSTKTVRIVYDCGSITKNDGNSFCIEECIKNEFEKDTKIDAVIISHFHEDHINGIRTLIDYCKVRRVYYPVVTSKNIGVLRAIFNDTLTQDLKDFVKDPSETLNKWGVKGIKVMPVRQNQIENGNINNNQPFIYSGENIFEYINKKFSQETKWLLRPYNFEQTEELEELKDTLKNEGIVDFDSFISSINDGKNKENIDKLKNAMRVMGDGKDMNINSMALLSAPNLAHKAWATSAKYSKSGCIYTGDICLKKKTQWNSFNKHLSFDNLSEIGCIGCIQVPHHGSKYSFNSKLIKEGCSYIISAGEENQYDHPDIEVLLELLKKRVNTQLITEETKPMVFKYSINDNRGIEIRREMDASE